MKQNVLRILAAFMCLVVLCSFMAGCSFFDDLIPTPDDLKDYMDSIRGDGSEDENYGDLPTSPVAINEVCSKNTVLSAPDKGKYDWIELYNQTEEDICLEGYGISDDKDQIKHVFNENITVPAKGYVVLWACGDVIAQGKATGSQYLPFSVSSSGETLYLFSSRGTVIDEMSVPALSENISYGYTIDCAGVLARLSSTIGLPNGEGEIMQLSDTIAAFSHESGFYNSAFKLTLDLPTGYTAYYTLDCTEPSRQSSVFPSAGMTVKDVSANENVYSSMYTGNIDQAYKGYTMTQLPKDPVDKCTVLRVVVYEDETNKCTDVITKSYFVGYNVKGGYDHVPVVSLVSKPDLLYGTNGLFTNPANWSKSAGVIEHMTNFAYFGEDHTYLFDQNIGLRLHGTSTRTHNQKSLTLFARQKYGSNVFEEAVVGEAKECHSMVLRTDGTTKIQEGFAQSLVSDRALSTCDYTPVVVFVDGEYSGVYNLYERFSGHYVEGYYGIDDDNVYIVKKGMEENVSGGLSAYNTMMTLLTNGDLANPRKYNELATMVDLQSLADLLSTQIYLCNADFSFSQNIAAWRCIDPSLEDPTNPYADGKWRFVLYDLDIAAAAWKPAKNFAGLGVANRFVCDATTNGFTLPSIWADAGQGIIRMAPVENLLKNDTFKTLFVKTFYEMLTVNFASDTVLAKLEETLDIYEPLMTKHFARWGTPVERYGEGSKEGGNEGDWQILTYYGGNAFQTRITGLTWRRVMEYAVDFYGNHPAYAKTHLEQYFSISPVSHKITVHTTLPEGGEVYLNGCSKIQFDEQGQWTGTYPTEYLYTFVADPYNTYDFVCWTIEGDGVIFSTTDKEITISSVTGDFTLTAQFVFDPAEGTGT